MFILPGLCNSVVASRTTRVRNNINATNDTGINSHCTVFRTVRNSTPHVVRVNHNSCTGPTDILGTYTVLLHRVTGIRRTRGLRGTLTVYGRGVGVANHPNNGAYTRFTRTIVSRISGLWSTVGGNKYVDVHPHFLRQSHVARARIESM